MNKVHYIFSFFCTEYTLIFPNISNFSPVCLDINGRTIDDRWIGIPKLLRVLSLIIGDENVKRSATSALSCCFFFNDKYKWRKNYDKDQIHLNVQLNMKHFIMIKKFF